MKLKRLAIFVVASILLLFIMVPSMAQDSGRISPNGIYTHDDTEVFVAQDDVIYSDLNTKMNVQQSMVVDDEYDIASKSKIKSDNSVDVDVDVLQDVDVNFYYEYDGKRLKETIVLNKAKRLSFPLKLAPETILIPWGDNGQFKIVSSKKNADGSLADTMTGIVAEAPFGTDADGNKVPMRYLLANNNTLLLDYDKQFSIVDRLAEPVINPQNGMRIPVYKTVSVKYPLTIDPTWTTWLGHYRAYNSTTNSYIEMFNATGKTTWNPPVGVTSAQYFVVAGGGAGGGNNGDGGGGGAGGVLGGNTTVANGTAYNVVVGAGGTGHSTAMRPGFNSSFKNTTVGDGFNAMGGGAGAGNADGNGGAGGSGGGAGGATSAYGGSRVSGQGYYGGNGYPGSGSAPGAGGGGGSAVNGSIGRTNGGGNGGAGVYVYITDEWVQYASGGGGSYYTSGGTPGAAGGRGATAGGITGGDAADATAATGSGAGGGYNSGTGEIRYGGSGGSGIVILRYNSSFVDFNATPTYGTTPLAVSFVDMSSYGTITNWNWSFGDGTYSALQHPWHTYSSAGNFSVNLTITVAGTAHSLTKTNYVIGGYPGIPAASFTSNYTYGRRPITVAFTDTSTNTSSAWLWTFGDGNTSTVQNPTFTYNIPGTYTVSLYAANPLGNSTATYVSYVRVGSIDDPVVSFYATKTTGSPGGLFQFVDASSYGTTSGLTCNWSFGDLGLSTTPYSSVCGNVSHVYPVSGVFDVEYTIENVNGTDTQVRPQYIIVSTDVQNTWYAPQQIRFTLHDLYGNPLDNIHVSATPLNFTAPDDWTNLLLGVQPSVDITGTTVSGYSGTDGSWIAPMMQSIQYQMTFYGTTSGGEFVNYTITIYPSSVDYILTIPTSSVPIAQETPFNGVAYVLANASVNSSYQFVNMTYLDTTTGTSALHFYVKNQSGVEIYNASYAGAGANSASFSQLFATSPGAYQYGFTAQQSYLGSISQYQTFNQIGHVSLFGTGEVTWVEQWLAIALLCVLAAGFSMVSVKMGVIVIPIIAGYFTFVLGWMQPAVGVGVFGSILTIMLIVGILKYMRHQSDKVT